jgi:hypothetical protein
MFDEESCISGKTFWPRKNAQNAKGTEKIFACFSSNSSGGFWMMKAGHIVFVGALWLNLGSHLVYGQTEGAATARQSEITTAPIVRETGPGRFQVGLVELDKQKRMISFPANVQMNDGIIEYVLVSKDGKTHESLLRTEVEPVHLQTAMLLLGAKGAPQTLTTAPAGGPLTKEGMASESAKVLQGDWVKIEVEWQVKDKTNRCAIEEWVLDVKAKKPMATGDFVFNGSRVWEGRFIAQVERSIISAVVDPDSMFNNPRPGRDDDGNWQVRKDKVPARETPVRVIIRVQDAKPAKSLR